MALSDDDAQLENQAKPDWICAEPGGTADAAVFWPTRVAVARAPDRLSHAVLWAPLGASGGTAQSLSIGPLRAIFDSTRSTKDDAVMLKARAILSINAKEGCRSPRSSLP